MDSNTLFVVIRSSLDDEPTPVFKAGTYRHCEEWLIKHGGVRCTSQIYYPAHNPDDIKWTIIDLIGIEEPK